MNILREFLFIFMEEKSKGFICFWLSTNPKEIEKAEEIEKKLSEKVYEEIDLRGHHLYHLAAKMAEEKESVLIGKMRGEEIRKVRITDRPDTVCEECPMYREVCRAEETSAYDRKITEEFGLKLGKTYWAKEVLEKIESAAEEYKKIKEEVYKKFG
jgi:hypothetical protein